MSGRATFNFALVTTLALLGCAAAARFSARHAAAVSAEARATASPGPAATSALATAAASNSTVFPLETMPGYGEVNGAALAAAKRRYAASLAARAGMLLLGLGAANVEEHSDVLRMRGGAFAPSSPGALGSREIGARWPTAPFALRYGGLEDDEERPLPQPLSREWRTELRSEDDLVSMRALGERGYVDVKLPPEWADNLVSNSLKRVVGPPPPQQEEVYRALLQCDPSFTVVFKISPTGSRQTRREIAIWERLAALSVAGHISIGNIAPLLDLQVFSESTYLLYAAGSGTLRELFDFERGTTVSELMAGAGAAGEVLDAGEPVMPMSSGLPLMIDVLRGMQNLEAAGIVHAGLSENNILLIDGRAYISDLGTSCLEHDGDPELCCRSAKDEEGSFIGSAFRHAPEMPKSGRPTGTSNTDWAFGLVLAESLLGHPPTEVDDYEHARMLDLTALGRRTLRWSIATSFRIEESAGFKKLAPWAQEVLTGLLDHNPAMRMNSALALKKLSAVAKSLGARVPHEPKPIRLPSAWWSGWFKGLAWQ